MLSNKIIGATAAKESLYVDDVFSTWLYAGNNTASQTINNGIDLAGEGGMVWIKSRTDANQHCIEDTARGVNRTLSSNSTAAQSTDNTIGVDAFNANGFSTAQYYVNEASTNYVSWTFRKAPKFFDVVTYTGTGSMGATVNHNLGSVPGMIIVRRTSVSGTNWAVYHRSLGNDKIILLNTTAASVTDNWWNDTTPTSTQFFISSDPTVNAFGDTFVAYLFAHNAGGFGTTGAGNVISCGSFTTDGSGNATINLGYEPQYVMWKASSATGNWFVEDVMRAFNLTSRAILFPNLSNAEATGASAYLSPNATGFSAVNSQLDASTTYIYMAIRRPMKPPTSGTEVFSPVIQATSGTVDITGPSPTDMSILRPIYTSTNSVRVIDRLRGNNTILMANTTAAESSEAYYKFDIQTGLRLTNFPVNNSVFWNFRRATGFFDVVCYTGTGAIRNLTHNLGKAPGMVIVRGRSSNTAGEDWAVWHQNGSQANGFLGARLNTTQAYGNYGQLLWQDDTTPPSMTSTTISLGTNDIVNASAKTYVAYLFGEVSGVSKVGSYTGNGSTQTINCGFTAGARFVMIKRTDSTGDWYVWDTARGIVSGNDPHLSLNTTAAEVTTNDSVDPDSSGFVVNQLSATNINVNAASYIFLAVA